MDKQENLVILERFFKKELLGKGAFGDVYLVEDKDTNEKYAAKILNQNMNLNSREDMIRLIREVNINAGLNHPAILKFIGYNHEPSPTFIFEYCKNGSLLSIINDSDKFSDLWNETKKLITIFGIASGMKYLHSNNIIHRDLKPENILVDNFMFPKIADFGLSKQLHINQNSVTPQSSFGIKGTCLYLAPEVFKTNESTKFSDVYAFGMILYEIIEGKNPFKKLDTFNIWMKVTNSQRPLFEKPINEAYRNLIEHCWDQDPNARPTFDEIVDELRNNKEYITPNTNEQEYQNYIKIIDEYPSSFINQQILKYEDYVTSISNKFIEIDIMRYAEQKEQTIFSGFLSRIGITKEKLYPADKFKNLSKECKELVVQAENDPLKQYEIGCSLIEGKNSFPLNIDIGVKYLESSIIGGNVEAVLYLSQIFIDGKVISRDLARAEKYLSTQYNKDDKVIFLYGKVLKKEKKLKEARKVFEKGSNKGDQKCMYKYAQILFSGEAGKIDVDKALHFFELTKESNEKSLVFLQILEKLISSNQSFVNLSSGIQYFFIKQIVKHKYNNKDLNEEEMIHTCQIKINENDIQNFHSKKLLDNSDFIQILQLFNEIFIDIKYPSKSYNSILDSLSKIKKVSKNKIKIFIYIKGINNVPSLFDPDNIVNTVIIESPATIIEEKAFYSLSSIERITISAPIKSIGSFAFSECSSLADIDFLSSSLSLIPYSCFSRCISITKITFPSSVTSIDSYAFNGCSSLTQITIPPSVESIGSSAFSGCSSLTQITIPPSVESIGPCAFSGCSSLTQITIPPSVKSIGSCAFSDCSSLTQITIPPSVNKFGEYIFGGVKSLTIFGNIKFIPSRLFYGRSSLTKITIPESVTSIGKECFCECESLVEIIIPESVTSIGECCFSSCISLKKITIPESVTSIREYCFYSCKKLQEISIQSSITEIKNYTFAGCSSLTQITIPPSVESIGLGAFNICSSLTQITIPPSVESIESSAFSNCSSLTQITIPPSVESIGPCAFSNCSSLTKITIPPSVESIGLCAFSSCSSLTKISIPSSVNEFGDHIFNGVKSLTIFGNIKFIPSRLFDRCSSLTKITIPESVTSIGKECFSNCKSLVEITIPESVTSIGEYCFYSCKKLQEISIQSSITEIKNCTFAVCSSLTQITIPPSVESIESSAFSDCSSLTQITIPPSVESIESSAFIDCSSLTQITIPSSVNKFGKYIFDGVKSLTIFGNIKFIPSFLFCGSSSLTKITIPNTVNLLCDYCFSNCTSLEEIVIPNSVTSIGKNCFDECSVLKKIVLPSALFKIGRCAFSNCTSLEEIVIPRSVTFIGDEAFLGCSSLKEVLFEEGSSLSSINEYSFAECVSLTKIKIPSSVVSIGKFAFNRCTSLRQVEIPSSVKTIFYYAFSECLLMDHIEYTNH